MSVTYVYSVSVDFPTGRVRADLLQRQIKDAVSITPVCEGITTNGDVCDVVFASALSGPQKTTLDGLVAVHNPGNGILAAKVYFIRALVSGTSLPQTDWWYAHQDSGTLLYSEPAEQTDYTYDGAQQLLLRLVRSFTTDGIAWTEVKYTYFTDPDTGDRVMKKEELL
jgi:hypothetical protein